MFERFTPRARRVLVVAQEEAKDLGHSFIAPEHMLLGLVQGDGIAARALRRLGVDEETLRAKVAERVAGAKTENPVAKVPFSPQAKKALELSLREALALGHNYIGTEHLVLGALRVIDDEDAVIQLLGVGADEVRTSVLAITPRVPGAPGGQQSPAVADAMRRAREATGTGPMTTGQLLLALLADGASQASRALRALGVTAETLGPELAKVPVGETTDAPPRPQAVEIKVGDAKVRIEDPELAATLDALSPEELGAALRRVAGTGGKEPPAEEPAT